MSLLWKHGYVVPPIILYVAPCPTESGDTVNSFICCLHAVTSFSFQRVFHVHQIYKWLFLDESWTDADAYMIQLTWELLDQLCIYCNDCQKVNAL